MVKSKFMTMRAEEALERMLREKIEMVDRWDKAQWPAYGAHAVARSQKTGEEIEIDALLVSRVRPLGKGFCYEYHYDAHDNFMRRTVSLPNGGKVYLVPPEHTLMEKLAAGRGAEQGKFDFYDCAGLITQVPLNPSVLRKVISSQRFDGHLLDRDVAQLLIGTSPVKVDDLFEELGILSPRFQQIVHQLGDTFVNEQMGKPQAKRVLSATTIKQIAFVDRCWRMADKIQQDAYLPVNIGPEVVSAAERFGADALTEKVAWLKRFFEHFALFETGRSDVFVRRGSSTDRALESSFFETLELQIERLQKLKS